MTTTNNADRCMQCGRCSASCPVAMDMDLPPHMWAYRLREGNEKSLLDCGAVWRCLACFCCEARCPRGVRPAHLAEEIRHTLLRAGSALSADDIPELVKNGMPQQLLVAALRKNR